VRLYPAFWVCCTITFVLILTIGSPRLTASFSQYLLNMTLMSNALGVPPIDGVYWSLFVEIKFYLLVGLILALGLIHQAERILIAWLAATVVLTALPIGIARSLLLTDYAPYFIGGAMSYLIWSRGPSLLRGGTLAGAWLMALVQALGELAEFDSHYQTRLDLGVVIAIISGFFIVMLLVAHRRTGLFGRRQWLGLGALTYPLYLLHQNIGYMLFNAGYGRMNPHLLFWGVVALMLLTAYGVHILIERRLALRLKVVLRTLLNAHPHEAGVAAKLS
jgi:peptidoglycan/LPS O-acetylase OafA/YrhL